MNDIVMHTGALVGLRTGTAQDTTTTDGQPSRVGVLVELGDADRRAPYELLVSPSQAAALVGADRSDPGVVVRFAGERLGVHDGVPLVRVGRIAVSVPETATA
jgi:hypothetical protein